MDAPPGFPGALRWLLSRDRLHCRDCGLHVVGAGEFCMLLDGVWAATGMGRGDGVLCVADIERRLGRKLRTDDFAISRSWADALLWPPGRPMLPRVWQTAQ